MSKESEFTKGYILVERCNKYYVMFRDKNGKQYCRSTKISILNEDNKPGRQYLYAQQAALKIIAEVEAAPEARKKTRFEDLVEAWLKSYEKDCLKQSTLITYKKNVEKHILPYFRNWRPEDITPFDVKEFLTKKAQSGNLQYEGYGLSNSYVSKLRTILMLIMECAVDKRMIAINPARGVSLPKTYNVRPVEERGVITPEQCREMLSLISDKKTMFSRMLKFTFTTAVREGELMGLKWDNVFLDDEEPHIYIKTVRSYISGHEVCSDTPKTVSSQNNIYLNQEIIDMLRLMKSEQERNKEQFGEEYSNLDNYVFVKPDGTPYKANYLTKQLEAFCKKHPEFPRISAHSLRTSCATWLVNEQGWTPLEAAAHLRHKNDDITKQYYIKTDSEDYRKKIGKKASCITI